MLHPFLHRTFLPWRLPVLLALALPLISTAQNTDGDWLFGSATLHTVELTFDDPNYWDSLTVNYDLGVDVPAHLKVDGVTYQLVGAQFKGNSSFNGPSDKKSFKIDMNEYYASQRIDGEKKFNLNNCFKDPSFLREKMFLDYLNANGVSAPRCTYAKLYINGSYWGLYTLVEAVDKTFLDNRFDDNSGNLFKGDPNGDFRWYGSDPAAYYTRYELHTNETENDWSDLTHAIDVVTNTTDALLADSIHARFKTQKLLRAWAANNLFVNLDSYLGSGHNYYIYHDSASAEWRWITWDVNEAFGNFEMGLSQNELENLPYDYVSAQPDGRPLYQRALNNAVLRGEYIAELCDLVSTLDTAWFRTRADSLRAVIDNAVQTDTHKFYSYGQFNQNVEAAVTDGNFTFPGVLPFLRTRVNNLSQQLAAVGCFSSVPVTSAAPSLTVGPVPASDRLHINNLSTTMRSHLLDLSGRSLTALSTSPTIDVRELANGTYILEVLDGTGAAQRLPVVVAH